MERVRCNLCGADSTVVRFPDTIGDWATDRESSTFACTNDGYGRHHTIVQCTNCGLVYANPRVTGDDIVDTYEAVEDPLYLEERRGRVLTFERHLKPLEGLTGSPDHRPLLDVGSYTGVFVETAARHGWVACGLEPSAWAVRAARERGLEVVQGTLETADLPDQAFDVVTMWDVIEHLTDPRGALEKVHRLLRPGGLLAVHTIDIESVFARLMGPRWPWLMQMHLYYFSRSTLRAMLEDCGYDIVGVQTQGRYLRLGYLMSRLRALAPSVGRPAVWAVATLGLRRVAVPVNLGDLFTAYARKRGG
jgi:ubiquinone/menaquinone biosynthesis C-methylase UbiE